MPKCLRRFHSTGNRHFITCSCYPSQPFLGSARRPDYFLKVFEGVRQKYDLIVWGYVVMPEHFHILISEPAKGSVARVMQVLKQRLSRACRKMKKADNQMKFWELPPCGRSGNRAPTISTCSPSASTSRSSDTCIVIP
jgi:REP element-mobilizing transposase RayT